MKKLILLVVLVAIAGIAGLIRSNSKAAESILNFPKAVINEHQSGGEVRDEIRRSFELAPGARVEVGGINGSVKIETADTRTAEVYVERLGKSQEALARRKMIIKATANSLVIRSEKGEGSFLSRVFGSSPKEKVTLRLPRQVSLATKGVNGMVSVGEINGPVEIKGVNGRVEIAGAAGSATFKGINGNVAVALSQLNIGGVDISGVNGNIDLKLGDGINAELEARGMNGRVISEMADVKVDGNKHGHYTAQIGKGGGSSISVSGINGNIRLMRMSTSSPS